ncbi:MAG: T9SS type A sorting domain-containing protein, partial [Flavobacteriaceae bacterium]
IHNSFSFKALLADASAPKRPFNYSEVSDLNYAISDGTYKLIKLGTDYELYDLPNDRRERFPLDLNTLSQTALDAYQTLFDELAIQITGWSCNDGIQNGNETGIDCGGDCGSCNLSTNIHQKPNINLVYIKDSKQIKIKSDFNLKGLKVFNVMGQQQTDLNLQDGILNASNLAKGLYVLRFYFKGDYTQLKKVIIY